MIKKMIYLLVSLLLVFGISQSAFALTVSSLYGDEDGFNLGIKDGHYFDWSKIAQETDEQGISDDWVYGQQTWDMYIDYSEIKNVTAIYLDIFTGGLSTLAPASLFLNNFSIGYIPKNTDEVNRADLDRYLLTDLNVLQNGKNVFSIVSEEDGDAWSMDFSKITVEGEATLPVPEPATIILLGCGLIGIAAFRRSRN